MKLSRQLRATELSRPTSSISLLNGEKQEQTFRQPAPSSSPGSLFSDEQDETLSPPRVDRESFIVT